MTAGSNRRARLCRSASMLAVVAMSAALANPAAAQTARGVGLAGGGTPNAASGSPSIPGATPAQQAAAARARMMQTRSMNARVRATSIQTQARDAARAALVTVPNGMKLGGLVVAPGAGTGTITWEGARLPVQTGPDGAPLVTIKQEQQKAILTWETMNVGRETTLHFDQTAGGVKANEWIALNRVEDASARPTQILGNIRAEGQVYIINRNGIIFGGASQVNSSSLVASALDIGNFGLTTAERDARFRLGILSSDPQQSPGEEQTQTSFSFDDFDALRDANGSLTAPSVVVEAGAQITGGTEGLVLLAGPNVSNAGSISAQNGQVVLGAGLGLGLKTLPATANQIELFVTARRPQNEFDPIFDAARDADGRFFEGTARNSGIISTPRGNVTLAGFNVEHTGVLSATTANNRPGSITLTAADSTGGFVRDDGQGFQFFSNSPRAGLLHLGEDSLVEIGAETGADQVVYSPDEDFQQSRIAFEGGAIAFERNALVLAPSATMRLGASNFIPNVVSLAEGAAIDLSGRVDVAVDIGRNIVSFEARGNELRDAPLQRAGLLNMLARMRRAISVDIREGSPLVDVGGAEGLIPYSVEELQTVGGSLTVRGGSIVTADNSLISVAGGSIAYQSGMRDAATRLVGADGRIYDIGSAPADIVYTGIAGEFTRDHGRWGVTENFRSTLFGASRVYEAGYIEGADAGAVSIIGQLYADGVIDGSRILGGRQLNDSRADDGNPAIKRDLPAFGQFTLTNSLLPNIVAITDNIADDYDQTVVRGTDEFGQVQFTLAGGLPDAVEGSDLSALKVLQNFGDIDVAGGVRLAEGVDLHLAAGSSITLRSADIAGSITAAGGNITITGDDISTLLPQDFDRDFNGIIRSTAKLSVAGEWVNNYTAGLRAEAPGSSAYIDGGSINVSIRQLAGNASPDVVLERGAVLDLSGGAYVGADQSFIGGDGGDLTLATFTSINNVFDSALADSTTGRIDNQGAIISAFGVGTIGGGRDNGVGGRVSIRSTRLLVGTEGAAVGLDDGVTRVNVNAWGDLGFSNVDLSAYRGLAYNAEDIAGSILVDSGAVLAPVTTNRIVDLDTALASVTGTAPVGLGRIGQLDQIDRGGTSIALRADGTLNLGGVNSVIRADAGSGATTTSIVVSSDDAYQVEGLLEARAGRIEIGGSKFQRITLEPLGGSPIIGTEFDPALAVWIADTARIDARGLFQSRVDENGLTLGAVRDGGTVSLNGGFSYLVMEQGSVIDVSGVAGRTDLVSPVRSVPLGPLQVSSIDLAGNAGSITINANGSAAGGSLGTFIDGTLIGQAGGAGARGGSLILGASGVTNPRNIEPTGTTTARSIVIRQSGTSLAEGVGFGDQIDPTLIQGLEDINFDGALDEIIRGAEFTGRTFFAADTLTGSGIDALQLGALGSGGGSAEGSVVFDGDVTLDAGRMLAINAPLIGLVRNADGTARDAAVDLTATYIRMSGRPDFTTYDLSGPTAGSLTFNADFFEIGNTVSVQGAALTTLNSKTDIRFAGPDSEFFNTGIAVAGDLTMRAAQIYPGTDVTARIRSASQTGTIRFERAEGAIGDTPLSAGGNLIIQANTVVQDGVLRAPLGSITFSSYIDPNFDPSKTVTLENVRFEDGSVTSVSLDRKIVPYGVLRTDRNPIGAEWYAGDGISTGGGFFVPIVDAPPEKIISINGANVDVQAGAMLDLSGGGDILAYRFIPGPGGSTDVLSRSRTDRAESQFADGRDVYAIIPGIQPFASPYSQFITDSGTSLGTGSVAGTRDPSINPYVGDSVELKGVPGIPDGTYTLLPGRYATVPGAYRVVATPHNAAPSLERPIAGAVTLPDGTIVADGYLGVNGTNVRDSRLTRFTIQSRDTWTQYSAYEFATGNDFFTNRANLLDRPVSRLARDAGQLTLGATQTLALNGTARFDRATGARGGLVDISAERIAITAGGADYGVEGYLSLDGAALSGLGAESLLIGGNRVGTVDGDFLNVTARALVIADGGTLTAPELLLVAGPGAIDVDFDGDGIVDDSNFDGVINEPRPGDGLTIAAGATLSATGPALASVRPLQIGRLGFFDENIFQDVPGISGDAALVRLAVGDTAPLTRANVDGTLARLTIESGASLAGGALLIDGTGAMALGADVAIDVDTIDLGASRISLGEVADVTDGLALDSALLTQIGSARTIILRGRDSIDAYGDVTLGLADLGSDAIRFDTALLRGFDADLTVQAENFAWTGGVATASEGLAQGGTFSVVANSIDLGEGSKRVEGFADALLSSSGALTGAGTGSLNMTGDLRIETGLLTQASGAEQTIDATGGLELAGSGTATPQGDGLGGLLTIAAASISGGAPIALRGGNIVMTARAGSIDLTAGAIDVRGTAVVLGDETRLTPAGSITLNASDAVRLGADVDLDVSAATATGFDGSGNAGSITIAANTTELGGTITGTAVGTGQSGRFTLVSTSAVDLDPLNATLDTGGFFGRRAVRSGAGDLVVGTTMRADDVSLVADGGSVAVTGTIDASGDKGGRIVLAGRDGVTLADSGLLDAHADGDERGGIVEIGATQGALNLGGRIDVGGDQAGGRVRMRVALADVTSSEFGSAITGARSVELEPFVTVESDAIDAGLIGDAFASVDVVAIRAATGLDAAVRITPGVELVSAGDLTLAAFSDIDLHTLRTSEGDAGVLTLRAGGDVTLLSSISDGFDGVTNMALQVNDLSWSYRVAAGASPASADPLAVSTNVAAGDILVSEIWADDTPTNPQIIRTGTGSIEFVSAGDILLRDPDSVVYTAGRPIEDINNVTGIDRNGNVGTGYFFDLIPPTYDLYNQGQLFDFVPAPPPVSYIAASFLRDGGDLRLVAGRDILATVTNSRGDNVGQTINSWLWRQGAVDVNGDFFYRPAHDDLSLFGQFFPGSPEGATQTAWWIDFSKFNQNLGVLGGGDADVRAGRDFRGSVVIPTTARTGDGVQAQYAFSDFGEFDETQGFNPLEIVRGATPNGTGAAILSVDGGGDLAFEIGRDIAGGSQFYVARGEADMRVGGSVRADQIGVADSFGGPAIPQSIGTLLAVGQGAVRLTATGDVSLAVIDPLGTQTGRDQGFADGPSPSNIIQGAETGRGGFTYAGTFVTYEDSSLIDITTVGGDFTLQSAVDVVNASGAKGLYTALGVHAVTQRGTVPEYDFALFGGALREGVGRDLLPPTLRVTAFAGDLVFPVNTGGGVANASILFDVLASPRGTLELRAGRDILRLNTTLADYDLAFVNTPFRPSMVGIADAAFYPNAPVPVRTGQPGFGAIIYAGRDIPQPVLDIEAPLSLIAGRDLTDVNVRIQHPDTDDFSIVRAGRDIGSAIAEVGNDRFADNAIEIGGGGRLRVAAGRNIYAIRAGSAVQQPGTQFGIRSIGNARNPALSDEGATIDVLFGLSTIENAGAFLRRLLDPANAADQYTNYNIELSDGSDGRRFIVEPDADTPMSAEALAAIYALSEEDQRSLAIDLFMRELDASGLEVNQPGPRQGSYIRGNSAVEALFPGIETDRDGPSTEYAGIFNLQNTAIRTEAGGDINVIGPGGDFLLGAISTVTDADPQNKGVLSVGYGNINLFAFGDIQVGQSRVFSIDGGDIMLWSSSQDINAGAGSKSLQFTPPLRTRTDFDAVRTVDRVGLVTGSGIANFAPVTPITDVQRLVDEPTSPADAFSQTEEERRRTLPRVNLVAPIGEVDAGDAGIRSVGNLNIAALTVVNAENIDVGGDAFGVPEQATVNVALNLDSANAAASAATAATEAARENRQRDRPSVVTVQVLGFGGEFGSPEDCIESPGNPCPDR